MSRTYGWRPDLPDKRDRYHTPRYAIGELPEHVDLVVATMPKPWDQLSLGSCTAFAAGGAIAYEYAVQGRSFTPSFLQFYYSERAMEGAVQLDAGAYIRDAAKVAAQVGVASAAKWPYITQDFARRPPKAAFKDALNQRVSSYARVVRTRDALRRTLAGGDTIVCGISVYESFESDAVARDGIVPLPAAGDDLLGGHAVLLVGYDDSTHRFKVRNSWGTSWGVTGYCYVPYDYILDPDLADDFWTIKCVTGAT